METNEKSYPFPVIVIQDRYGGTYSHGKWIAIAQADRGDRLEMVMSGAHEGDLEAMRFWDRHGNEDWIGIGATPDLAVEHLRRKGWSIS